MSKQEYLDIAINESDDLRMLWTGDRAISRIVVDTDFFEGRGDEVEVSGYVYAVYDGNGKLFLNSDDPEPFRLYGDESLSSRISSLHVDDLHELETYLQSEYEEAEQARIYQQMADEAEEQFDRCKQEFAQSFDSSGVKSLDEFNAVHPESHHELTDETKLSIIGDLNKLQELKQTHESYDERIKNALNRNTRNVDMDVSRLQFTKECIEHDIRQLEERYGLNDEADTPKVSVDTTIDTKPMEKQASAFATTKEIEELRANFGVIDEEDIDKFMTELEILSDPGIVR